MRMARSPCCLLLPIGAALGPVRIVFRSGLIRLHGFEGNPTVQVLQQP
jgi:hypothetical protein